MDNRSHIAPGTVLDGSYRIIRVVGAGGFGVTYEAEDLGLCKTVAIKEYFPDEFAVRTDASEVRPVTSRQSEPFAWGLKSFLNEARTLAVFKHPSIVDVFRIFEANATAYMVMEFIRGESFEDWLRKLHRTPSQAELDSIVQPLLDALALMHRHAFLHRDIAPDNIVIRDDGRPVLLDFGSARKTLAAKTHMMTGMVKQGYSPQEQYSTDGKHQGPWTDFYALGGTLYRAVSGHAPEEAPDRLLQDSLVPARRVAANGSYRPDFLAGIDACLQLRPAERPQSVDELSRLLLPGAASGTVSAPETGKTRIATRMSSATETVLKAWPLQRPRLLGTGVALGAGAALVVLAFSLYRGHVRESAVSLSKAEAQPSAVLTAAPPTAHQRALPMVFPDDPQEQQPVQTPPMMAPKAVPIRPWTALSTDVSGWKLKTTLRLGGALSDTAVSADRSLVAVSGEREGSLHILDALSLKPRSRIVIPGYKSYSLSGIAILPDNARLAVLRDGALEIYGIAGRIREHVFPKEEGYEKGSITVSKDGSHLYVIRSSISPQRSTLDVYGISAEGLALEKRMQFAARIDSFDVTADQSKFVMGTYPAQTLMLYDASAQQIVWERPCACSARFAANDMLVVFAGRPDGAAGDFEKPSSLGIIDVSDPDRRALHNTGSKETLEVTDISPDGQFAAISSTNNGQIIVVAVPAASGARVIKPVITLRDNSGQNVSGAVFVGVDGLISTSGDNNARLWRR